ncbi:unnamed protein product [Caenorhabditis angaria]|uniref:Protein CNPPD1 n=1 Tax=Caenorhabditis angaria TaxID=860376 RepID=A0A9P1IXZ2_9PELO|nr:unnamed protein product [Caenorhabditis angaria]
MAPLFTDFRKIRKRMKRTLNYGSKQPANLNFPLSELVVEYFDKKCTFDYMEPETSTSISKNGYADPCSLVVALVYLDRLRCQNKNYFESTDPTALYIPALVLASKYLHDADTYDRVSNSEWAESLKINADELNENEWSFVKNLDWNVSVKNEDFEIYLNNMEKWVANSFLKKNDFVTYNELDILSSAVPIYDLIRQLAEIFSSVSLMYCLTLALLSTTIQKVHFQQQPTEIIEGLVVKNQTLEFPKFDFGNLSPSIWNIGKTKNRSTETNLLCEKQMESGFDFDIEKSCRNNIEHHFASTVFIK